MFGKMYLDLVLHLFPGSFVLLFLFYLPDPYHIDFINAEMFAKGLAPEEEDLFIHMVILEPGTFNETQAQRDLVMYPKLPRPQAKCQGQISCRDESAQPLITVE
jgi:hypothetical protein